MRRVLALAVAMIATPLFAQQPPPDSDRHVVAPGNVWSIASSTCWIDASWDGDIGIVISPHADHHDLGLYDRHFTWVIDGKVVMLRYGTGEDRAGAVTNEALGHHDSTATSYVADVFGDLFDRIAKGGSMQVYRAKTTLADLDMTGFGAALGAMRTCEAALPLPADPMASASYSAPADAATPTDAAADAAMSAAADAAAEAASNAAAASVPRKPIARRKPR